MGPTNFYTRVRKIYLRGSVNLFEGPQNYPRVRKLLEGPQNISRVHKFISRVYKFINYSSKTAQGRHKWAYVSNQIYYPKHISRLWSADFDQHERHPNATTVIHVPNCVACYKTRLPFHPDDDTPFS